MFIGAVAVEKVICVALYQQSRAFADHAQLPHYYKILKASQLMHNDAVGVVMTLNHDHSHCLNRSQCFLQPLFYNQSDCGPQPKNYILTLPYFSVDLGGTGRTGKM